MADSPLRLAENIAFIKEVCENIIPPTRNEPPDGRNGENRKLELGPELEIVNCLSYLATYSDHPGQVMALCVEEKEESHGVVVSIATNNDDASGLERGVRSIVDVLQRQALDSKGDYLDILLEVVLLHAPDRLIERFGYPDSTTARRLEQAVQYASRTGIATRQTIQQLTRLSNDFTGRAETLKQPLLSNQVCCSDIINLLVVATSIWKNHRKDLEQIMTHIPSLELCPSAKDVFLHRLRQLAQYKLAATKLLRHARQLSILQSVSVQTIHIGATDLQPLLSDPPLLSTGLLNRYIHCHKKARTISIATAMNALGPHQYQTSLQSKLQKRIVQKSAAHKYRVHAEMQLLVHYETNKAAHPPRVLKSNKDACYICHLFIQTHGHWYIPKTHGRVYDLWMLPDALRSGFDKEQRKEWSNLIKKFNEEVERVVLQAALRSGDKAGGGPRESAIFSLASTSTSAQASVVSRSDSEKTVTRLPTRSGSSSTIRSPPLWSKPEGAGDEGSTAAQEVLISPLTPASPFQAELKEEESPSGSVDPIEMGPERETRWNGNESPPPRDRNAFPEFQLEPGLARVYTFDKDHTGVHFHTRKIYLELSRSDAEYLAARPTSRRRVTDLHIHIAWLDHRRADQLLSECGNAVMDLQAGWTTLEPEERMLLRPLGLLIRNGDDLVQIKARLN